MDPRFLRLVGSESGFENRAHFFGAASKAVRRVLVEHARKRLAGKRGIGAVKVTLDDLNVQNEAGDVDLLALDEALQARGAKDDRLSQVVNLRYFRRLGVDETAKLTGTSPATVKRDWTYARAWLFERIRRNPE